MSFRVPEQYRLARCGPYSTSPGDPFGAFIVPARSPDRTLKVIATDGQDGPGVPPEAVGWEHVSVSVAHRGGAHRPVLPAWEEMCLVKSLFWEPEDVVVQFHPRESEYVNYRPVLHLWRSWHQPFPTPAPILVGPKAAP